MYNPEKASILRVNASEYGIYGIYLQKHDGREHPVEYWSRKMTPAEVNYTVPNQKLLTIVELIEH